MQSRHPTDLALFQRDVTAHKCVALAPKQEAVCIKQDGPVAGHSACVTFPYLPLLSSRTLEDQRALLPIPPKGIESNLEATLCPPVGNGPAPNLPLPSSRRLRRKAGVVR